MQVICETYGGYFFPSKLKLFTKLLGLLAIIWTSGCGNGVKDPEPVNKKPAKAIGVPLQYNYDSIYNLFVKELEMSINAGDGSYFNSHFDVGPIINEVVEPVRVIDDLKNGFRQGLANNLDVGGQIVGSLGTSGHYKCLRLRGLQEAPSALFRLVTEGGINYHSIDLEMRVGAPLIKDFYIYMGGVPFSSTVNRLFVASLAEIKDTAFYQDLSELDRSYLRHTNTIDKIAQLVNKRKFKKAFEALNQLPLSLQEDKMIQIMRLNVAFNVDDLAYRETLEAFKKLYPDDPVIDLMQVDFAFSRKNYEDVIMHIEELDHKVGGDPYLKVMKADVYKSVGKKDSAEILLKSCIKAEPELEEAYWNLLDILLSQERYGEVVDLFQPMQDVFEVNPARFILEDGYDQFWFSQAYLNWEKKVPLDSVGQKKLNKIKQKQQEKRS